MSLEQVAGRRYGPVSVGVDPERVGAFVLAVGEDPDRWESFAPPSFAAALLFSIAPEFLADPDVTPYTQTLIHSEQRFTWSGPLAIGGDAVVSAQVESVRERRGLWFVAFSARASGGGTTIESHSTFLLSDNPAGDPEERPEPAATEGSLVGEPSVDGSTVAMDRAASRADLVRYAAASGDFNPIHWDHASAVGAGLPGIVCHGLLVLSWVTGLAGAVQTGAHPVSAATARFRKPLFPAVTARVAGDTQSGETLEASVVAEGETLVTAKIALA